MTLKPSRRLPWTPENKAVEEQLMRAVAEGRCTQESLDTYRRYFNKPKAEKKS